MKKLRSQGKTMGVWLPTSSLQHVMTRCSNIDSFAFKFVLDVLGHCVDGAQKASVMLTSSCTQRQAEGCGVQLLESLPPAYCVECVFQAALLLSISGLLRPQLLSTKRPRYPQPTQTQHLVSMDMQGLLSKIKPLNHLAAVC